MSLTKVARVRRTLGERERVKKDLFHLASKYLDFTLMTEEFHGEVARFWDKHRNASEVAVFTPRDSYKTTLMVAYVIQSLLRNPFEEIFYIHHQLDKSREVIKQVGEHLLFNDKLRAIWPPEFLPSPKNKQWLKTDDFRLPGVPATKARHPSISARSLGMNLTGDHPTLVILDDIVNSDSVQEMGNADAIRKWTEHTLTSILGAAGKARLVGTVWSDADYHWDILKPDSGWKTYVRAIAEKDGEPCPVEEGGIPIPILVDRSNPRPLSKTDILNFKRRARRFFNSQYMMQADRAGMRPWDPEKCEHRVQLAAIQKYLRKIIILSDPAPLGVGEKPRRDGEKDEWSIAVIGVLYSQNRTAYVLLDGKADTNWTTDAGLRRIRGLMLDWNTPYVAIEEPPAAVRSAPYATRLKDLCRQEGLRLTSIKLESIRMPKVHRIADLAAAGEVQDFFICEDTCNKSFLEKFLFQVQNFAGENSLAHDDVVDCVAYCLDRGVAKFLPKPRAFARNPDNPFLASAGSQRPRVTKYCPW